MYLKSHSLRAIAWSTLAVSAARAQYVIDNLSFGQKAHVAISPIYARFLTSQSTAAMISRRKS